MTTDLYDDTPEFDEGLDPDGPSAADLERFGSEHKGCPECGSEVYEEIELCPHCGHAFEEPAGTPGRWVALVALVVVIAFLILVLF